MDTFNFAQVSSSSSSSSASSSIFLFVFVFFGFVVDGCPSDLSVLLSRYSKRKDKNQIERISMQKLPADSVWWRVKCYPTTNEGRYFFRFPSTSSSSS